MPAYYAAFALHLAKRTIRLAEAVKADHVVCANCETAIPEGKWFSRGYCPKCGYHKGLTPRGQVTGRAETAA